MESRQFSVFPFSRASFTTRSRRLPFSITTTWLNDGRIALINIHHSQRHPNRIELYTISLFFLSLPLLFPLFRFLILLDGGNTSNSSNRGRVGIFYRQVTFSMLPPTQEVTPAVGCIADCLFVGNRVMGKVDQSEKGSMHWFERKGDSNLIS